MKVCDFTLDAAEGFPTAVQNVANLLVGITGGGEEFYRKMCGVDHRVPFLVVAVFEELINLLKQLIDCFQEHKEG